MTIRVSCSRCCAPTGIDSFLINNPFVHRSDEKLYGVVFIDNDKRPSEKDFKWLRKKYFLVGLSGLNIFQRGKSVGEFSKVAEY